MTKQLPLLAKINPADVPYPPLDRPNTVAGLLEKRAELAALLKFHRAEIRKIICDMDHLDAAIRMFDANADTSRVKRYPTMHRAVKGEVVRYVLQKLREAKAPMTSLDLTLGLIERRKLKADDQTIVLIRKRVGACLTKLRADGVIQAIPELIGEYKGWEIARREG